MAAISTKDAERRLDGAIIEVPAGTLIGYTRKDHQEIRLHMPGYVEISIDLDSLVKKALRNKTGRAKAGPVTARKSTGISSRR